MRGAYEFTCSQLYVFISLLSSHSCFSIFVDSELGASFGCSENCSCLLFGATVNIAQSFRNPSCFQSCNFAGIQAPYKIFDLLMAPFLGPGFFNNKSLLSVREAFGGRENRHLCTDALLFWFSFLWCVISLKFSMCLFLNFFCLLN